MKHEPLVDGATAAVAAKTAEGERTPNGETAARGKLAVPAKKNQVQVKVRVYSREQLASSAPSRSRDC